MSKRTLILLFIGLAAIAAAYLSLKADREPEPEEIEPEPEEIEPEPEEIEPEPKPEPKPKKSSINKTATDEPIQEVKDGVTFN